MSCVFTPLPARFSLQKATEKAHPQGPKPVTVGRYSGKQLTAKSAKYATSPSSICKLNIPQQTAVVIWGCKLETEPGPSRPIR